ncbi:MAG: hypothetical protein ACFFD2_10140 [Promethearchaeota archaeon]
MRIIDELWITTASGLTLFNQSKDQFDPLLIGGFFSAIHTFAQNLGEKEVKSIILGESKLIVYQGILQDKRFLFISRSPKKVKNDMIIKLLKLVETKFFQQYKDHLVKWNGDSDLFNTFGPIIQEIFNDTPTKRAKEAIW